MRTTLKRGVGRGATLNGNGRAAVPPAPLGPVTVYHQPPPPARSGRSLALAILGWSVLVLAVLIGGTAGGAYLYLHESVAAVAPKTAEVKKALEKLDLALPGEPATALMIGYDHRADEGKNTPSRSDTLMLVRADPGEKTISLLSFPRDLSVEIHCPGHSPFVSKINAAYATCGPTGAVTTVRDLTGVPINYIADRQLPGLPAARRQARRRLDRRRPALLQRPRRAERLREDQPAPRLPAPERHQGPRLRPLPPHRLGRLPDGAPAALRARVQGPDRVGVLGHEAAAGDQGRHLQRRGGTGWRQGRERKNGAPVRAARVLPPRAGIPSRPASTGSRASPT